MATAKRKKTFRLDLISSTGSQLPQFIPFESEKKARDFCKKNYKHYKSCKLNGVELNKDTSQEFQMKNGREKQLFVLSLIELHLKDEKNILELHRFLSSFEPAIFNNIPATTFKAIIYLFIREERIGFRKIKIRKEKGNVMEYLIFNKTKEDGKQ